MAVLSPRMTGFLQLIFWYVPVLVVQWLSMFVTVDAVMTWYPMLRQPAWNPPDWIFGPVWTVLYFSMALAVWCVYRSDAPGTEKRRGYVLFFAQLLANGMWSYLFFGCHSPAAALLDLVVLLALIAAMVVSFFRIQRVAGIILIPYLLWTAFALSLNVAIWLLN